MLGDIMSLAQTRSQYDFHKIIRLIQRLSKVTPAVELDSREPVMGMHELKTQ